MKHGGEGRYCVRSGRDNFAHHVYAHCARLAYGELYLRTSVAAPQRGAQARVGLFNGEAAQMDGAVVLHVHLAFGRNGGADGFLRRAPYVDKHLVARSELVVGGRCDVHVWFEGEFFLVEDVASEHLYLALTLAALFFEHSFVHGERVGQDEVELAGQRVLAVVLPAPALVVAQRRLVHSFLELPAPAVGLVIFSAFVAVVFAQAALHVAGAAQVFGPELSAGLFFLVFIAYAAYLLNADAPFDEFGDDFVAVCSPFVFFYDELHHLLVGHGRLRPCGGSDEEQEKGDEQ